MPHDVDLKRRLELAGLVVTEVAGWKERGSSSFNPAGSVNHHTAGPRAGSAPSLGIVINGRSDLPGPLCNVYGPREESRRIYLVAAGRANHAGRGGWAGRAGNSSVLGLEEEHTGTAEEPLSSVRLDRMARVHAAFAYGRFDAAFVCQHWEWTTRKIDFLRAHVDPVDFRRRVADHLRAMAAGPLPPPAPPVLEEDLDMPTILRNPENGGLWSCNAADFTRHRVTDREVDYLVFFGMARIAKGGKPADAPVEFLRRFKVIDS